VDKKNSTLDDEKNSLLDWDKIMKTVREDDRAKEEMAFRRYRARIQQSEPGQFKKEASDTDTQQHTKTALRLFEPKQLKWAASETSEMEAIRQRIGTEFEKRSPISLKLYSAELYVLDRDSALLIFKKGDELATDLNGKIIDFFLIEEPSSSFSETIQEEEVVINFQKLGIAIEEYAKVAFRIHLDEAVVIEERLGDEHP